MDYMTEINYPSPITHSCWSYSGCNTISYLKCQYFLWGWKTYSLIQLNVLFVQIMKIKEKNKVVILGIIYHIPRVLLCTFKKILELSLNYTKVVKVETKNLVGKTKAIGSSSELPMWFYSQLSPQGSRLTTKVKCNKGIA